MAAYLIDIIDRAQWGAQWSAGFGPAPTATELWLHHTVMASPGPDASLAHDITAMRAIERVGQERFGGGISYTFIVMESGRIFEGTGAGRRGAHTGGRNTIARAICMNGNYQTKAPNPRMVASIAALVVYGHNRAGYWTVDRLTGGHRDAPGASTACPGNAGHAAIPAINRAATSAAPTPTPEDSDMLLTEITAAVKAAVPNPWTYGFGRGDARVTAGQLLARSARDSAAALAVAREVASRPASASAIDPAELERIITEAADRIEIDVTVTAPKETP